MPQIQIHYTYDSILQFETGSQVGTSAGSILGTEPTRV